MTQKKSHSFVHFNGRVSIFFLLNTRTKSASDDREKKADLSPFEVLYNTYKGYRGGWVDEGRGTWRREKKGTPLVWTPDRGGLSVRMPPSVSSSDDGLSHSAKRSLWAASISVTHGARTNKEAAPSLTKGKKVQKTACVERYPARRAHSAPRPQESAFTPRERGDTTRLGSQLRTGI